MGHHCDYHRHTAIPDQTFLGQCFRGTADCCLAGLARADQVRAGCWNEEYRPHASYVAIGFLVADQRRGRTRIQPNLNRRILTSRLEEFLAIREELLLQIIDVLAGAGVALALPRARLT